MAGDLEKEARAVINRQLKEAGWNGAKCDRKEKPVLTDGKVFYPK